MWHFRSDHRRHKSLSKQSLAKKVKIFETREQGITPTLPIPQAIRGHTYSRTHLRLSVQKFSFNTSAAEALPECQLRSRTLMVLHLHYPSSDPLALALNVPR